MSEKCPDCGKVPYNSPSPSLQGKKEHFCDATKGMVIEGSKSKLVSESESRKKKST